MTAKCDYAVCLLSCPELGGEHRRAETPQGGEARSRGGGVRREVGGASYLKWDSEERAPRLPLWVPLTSWARVHWQSVLQAPASNKSPKHP